MAFGQRFGDITLRGLSVKLNSDGESKLASDVLWQVAPTSIDKLRRQGCRNRHDLMT